MIREAKTHEEFNAIKAEYCDAPAPWDNKNLSVDWLENEAEFFDGCEFVKSQGEKKYLGYVDGIPCEMQIRHNIIHVRLSHPTQAEASKIRERIEATFDYPFDEDNNKVTIILVDNIATWNKYDLVFFWTNEE